jgi:hypothetical protein
VGVNGYYYLPGQNFVNVFGPVIADIRRFTHAPLLIGETAVGPLAAAAGDPQIIHAAPAAQRVLGLVWFDRTSHGGVYKQDWRLEGTRPRWPRSVAPCTDPADARQRHWPGPVRG